ncbi:uncharacterized protein LOC119942889 [Tachyglossus aculeatus]|uniref:uncharacterized protein LOC119942889 n=1 Tax=Tachyglossus aculeatus TaxID=9261 RepID=UPI0018F2C590|nr:uncharacterized protein LOC119942889 [Tachyglossus aculeatus]
MPNTESSTSSEEEEEDSDADQETEQPSLLSGNPGSELRDHGHHILDSVNTRLGQLQLLGLRDSGNQAAGENPAQSPASHVPQSGGSGPFGPRVECAWKLSPFLGSKAESPGQQSDSHSVGPEDFAACFPEGMMELLGEEETAPGPMMVAPEVPLVLSRAEVGQEQRGGLGRPRDGSLGFLEDWISRLSQGYPADILHPRDPASAGNRGHLSVLWGSPRLEECPAPHQPPEEGTAEPPGPPASPRGLLEPSRVDKTGPLLGAEEPADQEEAQAYRPPAPPALRHGSGRLWGNTSRFSSSSSQRTKEELDTMGAQADPNGKSPARTWRSGWHIANEEPFWWPEGALYTGPPRAGLELRGPQQAPSWEEEGLGMWKRRRTLLPGAFRSELQVAWEPPSRPLLALRAAEPKQEPGGRFEDPERCRMDREPEQLQGREEAAAAAWTPAAAPEKLREENCQQLQEEEDATLAQLRQELGEAQRALLEEQSRWEDEKQVALQQQREMLQEQSRQAQAEAGAALETERQAGRALQGRVAELQAQVEQLERHVQQLQDKKEKETQLRLHLQEQLLEKTRVLREEANQERARDHERWGTEVQQLRADLREVSGREEAVLAQLERADRAVALTCQQLQSLLPEPLASPLALAAAARGRPSPLPLSPVLQLLWGLGTAVQRHLRGVEHEAEAQRYAIMQLQREKEWILRRQKEQLQLEAPEAPEAQQARLSQEHTSQRHGQPAGLGPQPLAPPQPELLWALQRNLGPWREEMAGQMTRPPQEDLAVELDRRQFGQAHLNLEHLELNPGLWTLRRFSPDLPLTPYFLMSSPWHHNWPLRAEPWAFFPRAAAQAVGLQPEARANEQAVAPGPPHQGRGGCLSQAPRRPWLSPSSRERVQRASAAARGFHL